MGRPEAAIGKPQSGKTNAKGAKTPYGRTKSAKGARPITDILSRAAAMAAPGSRPEPPPGKRTARGAARGRRPGCPGTSALVLAFASFRCFFAFFASAFESFRLRFADKQITEITEIGGAIGLFSGFPPHAPVHGGESFTFEREPA